MKVILDSGAFSAWMKQTEISIQEYAKFCLERLDQVDYIVNLDVIPGKYGDKNPSEEEIARCIKQGWENYNYLVDKGIPKEKLIHVFHQGEPFALLERMVYEMDYIGLSPANDRTTAEKMQWLDGCMDHVCDSDGMPKIKFHGFGVTSMPILFRYPWFSCDSTSWVQFGKYGMVLFPKRRQGKYRYDLPPYTIKVSSRSPTKMKADKHIDTMSLTERTWFISYIEEKGFELGVSFLEPRTKVIRNLLKDDEIWVNKDTVEIVRIKGLSNSGVMRDRWNLLHYLFVEQSMPKWPWPFKHKNNLTLF
jgi:hypothetical protein